MKVRADSRPNFYKKRQFCSLKRQILLHIVKIRQKSIFSPQGGFFVILSVFCQKQNPLKPNYDMSAQCLTRRLLNSGGHAVCVCSDCWTV